MPEDIDGLEDGLTVLEAQDTAISAAYRRGDVVVYFEALRGQPRPDAYQDDSGVLKYEVDARFVADNGRVFFSQRGGDAWVNPRWVAELGRQDELPPTRESNEMLFEIAAEAADVLDLRVAEEIGEMQAAQLLPEIDALRSMGHSAAATFAEQKLRLLEHRAEEGLANVEIEYGSGDAEDAPIAQLGANYYYIAVHDMTIYLFGKHSATRLYSWQGYWLNVYNSCNHGDCANTMGIKCLLQYYDAVEDYKPAWDFQTCGTGYNAWSDSGGHNCHDDTRVQMANFVYGNGHNKTPGGDFWCDDGDSDTDISVDIWGVELDQSGSPDCNAGTNKGYNHPDMCRFTAVNPESGYNADGHCFCDAGCMGRNDCCIDGPYGSYTIDAAGTTAVTAYGCQAENACGGYAANAACWCDSYCAEYGDCCSDGPC